MEIECEHEENMLTRQIKLGTVTNGGNVTTTSSLGENILSILKANQMKIQERIITCVKWDTHSYSKYVKEKEKLWKIYDSTDDKEKKRRIKKIIDKKKKEVIEKETCIKQYKKRTSNYY